MKVVNIERVIISAEELATLEKAKDILETMSLCGCAVSDDAIEIAESLDGVIENVLVCDEDDTGAFISFASFCAKQSSKGIPFPVLHESSLTGCPFL